MENLSQQQLQQAAHAFLVGDWNRPNESYSESMIPQQVINYGQERGVQGLPHLSQFPRTQTPSMRVIQPAPQAPPRPTLPWFNNSAPLMSSLVGGVGAPQVSTCKWRAPTPMESPTPTAVDAEFARHMKEGAFVHQMACAGASRRAVQNKAANILQRTILNGDDSKLIATDENGDVIGNKLQLHSLITKYAGILLDLGKVYFRDHDENQDVSKVEKRVREELHFAPFPLKKSYIRDFLQTTIKDARYKWQQHYKKNRNRHPKCKIQWYLKLQPYWESEEFKQSSQEMLYAYSCRSQGSCNPDFYDESDSIADSAVPERAFLMGQGSQPLEPHGKDPEGRRAAGAVMGTSTEYAAGNAGISQEESLPDVNSAGTSTRVDDRSGLDRHLCEENVEAKLVKFETTLTEHSSTLIQQNAALLQQSAVQKEILEIVREMKANSSHLQQRPDCDEQVMMIQGKSAIADGEGLPSDIHSSATNLRETNSELVSGDSALSPVIAQKSGFEQQQHMPKQSEHSAKDVHNRVEYDKSPNSSNGEPKHSLPGYVIPIYDNADDATRNGFSRIAVAEPAPPPPEPSTEAPMTVQTTMNCKENGATTLCDSDFVSDPKRTSPSAAGESKQPRQVQCQSDSAPASGDPIVTNFPSTKKSALSSGNELTAADECRDLLTQNETGPVTQNAAFAMERTPSTEPSTFSSCPNNPSARSGRGLDCHSGGWIGREGRGRGTGSSLSLPGAMPSARTEWRAPAPIAAAVPHASPTWGVTTTADMVSSCAPSPRTAEEGARRGNCMSAEAPLNPYNFPLPVPAPAVKAGKTAESAVLNKKARQSRRGEAAGGEKSNPPANANDSVDSTEAHSAERFTTVAGAHTPTNHTMNSATEQHSASCPAVSATADCAAAVTPAKKRGRPKKPTSGIGHAEPEAEMAVGTRTAEGVIVEVREDTQSKPPRQRRRRTVPARLVNRVAPKEVLPRLSQAPLPSGTEVWVLHPAGDGRVVASGKTGPHYQNRHRAANGMPLRVCKHGQQIVEIMQIVMPGMRAMYAEENGVFKTVDEAGQAEYSKGAKLVWDTHLLQPM